MHWKEFQVLFPRETLMKEELRQGMEWEVQDQPL